MATLKHPSAKISPTRARRARSRGLTLDQSIEFGFPSINEQNEITDYIENKIREIEQLISKTQQEIELLKEYKTALISEVVTGKVDVRDLVN